MTIRLAPGMSLPGQTYLARRPIALLDVAESPHMIRAPFLKESGLQAGAGVPVFIGDEVVAVMEFFWHDAPEPGSRLLQVLTFVGAQLGRVIERQRARDALQARERQFRALIENASDVITILEANGTIRYESPAVERVLGYRPEELVGLNAFEFVHPDDQATIVAEFAQKTQEPDSVSRMEFRFRHKDGSWQIGRAHV